MNKKFTTALSKSQVVQTCVGTWCKLEMKIDPTAATGTYYVQYYDANAVPADGVGTTNWLKDADPIYHVNGTVSRLNIDNTNGKTNDENGIGFTNGMVWVISSTRHTKTIVASDIATATTLTA